MSTTADRPRRRKRSADPDRVTLRPDPDAIDRRCANLSDRYGDLRVEIPDACTGSVRIVQMAAPCRSWRFTVDERLIPEPRKEWGTGGRRS
jgi:hypothetical protein